MWLKTLNLVDFYCLFYIIRLITRVLKYLREGMCYRKVTTNFTRKNIMFSENDQKLRFSLTIKINRKIFCERDRGYWIQMTVLNHQVIFKVKYEQIKVFKINFWYILASCFLIIIYARFDIGYNKITIYTQSQIYVDLLAVSEMILYLHRFNISHMI